MGRGQLIPHKFSTFFFKRMNSREPADLLPYMTIEEGLTDSRYSAGASITNYPHSAYSWGPIKISPAHLSAIGGNKLSDCFLR